MTAMEFILAVAFGIKIMSTKSLPVDPHDTPNKLMTDFYNWRLRDAPEWATQMGVHDFDDRLEDVSLQGFRNRKNNASYFLDRVKNLIMSNTAMGSDAMFSLRILQLRCQLFIDGYNLDAHLYPISSYIHPIMDFEDALSGMRYQTESDFNNYVARWKAFPTQIHHYIELLEEGLSKKKTRYYGNVYNLVNETLQKFEDIKRGALENKKLATADVRKEFKTAMQKQISQAVSKAYNSIKYLTEFLERNYIPNSRNHPAASSLPDGRRYYSLCLEYYTGIRGIQPMHVFTIGEQEVERISNNINKLLKQTKIDADLRTFVAKLKEQPAQRVRDQHEGERLIKDVINTRIKPVMKKFFHASNKLDQLSFIPSKNTYGMATYYRRAAGAGELNFNAGGFLRFEAPVSVLHEAIPGHHLQFSVMASDASIPEFRQKNEDRAYNRAPASFPIDQAIVEGWGLYVEILGKEMGIYKTDLEELGQYSYDMIRAVRTVVDVGLHYERWNYSTAQQYIEKYLPPAEDNYASLLDRCTTLPGQAVSYKVGQRKIIEMREHAMRVLGDYFDLRDFHDVVLRSVAPLQYLEDRVNDYILITLSKQRKKQTATFMVGKGCDHTNNCFLLQLILAFFVIFAS